MCKENPRILFVDDDVDSLYMFQIAAEHRGWHAEIATTGEAMLQRVNEACAQGGPCYDIIVTDVHFFTNDNEIRMTGMAAGREVRDKFPNLPILFLTGYGGQMTRENVDSIGNAALLVKPIDTDVLMDRIDKLMTWPNTTYQGVERRRSSVNRSGYMRRATDKRLEVPAVLSRAMNSVRRTG